MQVSLLSNININPQNVILTYVGFMVTANRCSTPWKITKMFPNNSSKINISDKNSWIKPPWRSWFETTNHRVSLGIRWRHCGFRRMLHKETAVRSNGKEGEGRVKFRNLTMTAISWLSSKIMKLHLQWPARKQASEFFFRRGRNSRAPSPWRDTGTTLGKHRNWV